MVELVSVQTSDGVELHGIYLKPALTSLPTIVHVHGKCGNFYQNYFIRIFIQRFRSHGLGFLAVNTRGRDCLADTVVDENIVYLGGSLERFNDCLFDLEAMRQLASNASDVVIFQGHSFGCEKVLHFALNRITAPLVLLSPSSSWKVQELYTRTSIEDQLAKLDVASKSTDVEWFDLAQPSQYGVRVGDIVYPIPISREALRDLLNSEALELLRFQSPWIPRRRLDAGFVYLGGNDPYLTESVEAAHVYFRQVFSPLEFLTVDTGNHHFRNFEHDVADSIALWARQLASA